MKKNLVKICVIMSLLWAVSTAYGIIYDLETLQSPDGTFTLTMGSDCHLNVENNQCSMDWQQVHEYNAATEKLKSNVHQTAMESMLFNEIELSQIDGLKSSANFYKNLNCNRRTASSAQDFFLTPMALACNKIFRTNFTVPPTNRGFMSNLCQSLLENRLKNNFVSIDFRLIEYPFVHVYFFMNFIDDLELSLKTRNNIHKVLDDKDFNLVDTLRMHMKKYTDKTMTEIYADTAKVYPVDKKCIHSYKFNLVTGISDHDGDIFSLRDLVQYVSSTLLDAYILMYIHETKARGIKNFDLFMGGNHIEKIGTRLKARGWKIIKKESQEDKIACVYSWKNWMRVSNMAKYFNELYKPEAQEITFVGGVPLRPEKLFPQQPHAKPAPEVQQRGLPQQIGRFTISPRL